MIMVKKAVVLKSVLKYVHGGCDGVGERGFAGTGWGAMAGRSGSCGVSAVMNIYIYNRIHTLYSQHMKYNIPYIHTYV